MAMNRNILKVGSNITLTTLYNSILCDHSTPITITLPSDDADGINYKINRNDYVISNTVTLSTGGNNIINGSIISPTFSVDPGTFTEIISRNSNWYILTNTHISSINTTGLFSTTFVANNSSPYLELAGNQSSVAIVHIPFSTLFKVPILFSVSTTWISSNPTGSFGLYAPDGTLITSLAVAISSSPAVATFSTTIIGFPVTPIPHISLLWNGNSGGGDKFGLNFVQIT
jgi:hypothetical protein